MHAELSHSTDFTSFLTGCSISAEGKEGGGAKEVSSPALLVHIGKFTALYTREQPVAS
jgi:hypothetical protein